MSHSHPEKDVENEALDAIEHFMDEIIQAIIEHQSGDAPSRIDNYSESYANEYIGDRGYNPKEAIEVLDALSEYEDDPGYIDWKEDWRGALSMLAASTFANAVSHRFSELMESLNGDIDLADANGEIQWELPEPEMPRGVLEWSPKLEKKRAAWEKERERLEAGWPEKVKKDVQTVIERFIRRERPR